MYNCFLLVPVLLALVAVRASSQINPDECSDTRAWVPVGADQAPIVTASVVMNEELYVLRHRRDSTYELIAWNGSAWHTVSQFFATGTIADMQEYEGNLYISGGFRTVDQLSGTDGIARWTGSAWEAVPGSRMRNSDGTIRQTYHAMAFPMTVYNGELYVAGAFTAVDGIEPRGGIMAFDGSGWRAIADHSRDTAIVDSIMVTAFAELNGELYVGGFFSRIGGTDAHGLAKWDGTSWSAVGTRDMRAVRGLAVLNSRLYVVRHVLQVFSTNPQDEHLTWWDGVSWHDMPGTLPPDRLDDFFEFFGHASFGGELYFSITRTGMPSVFVRVDTLGAYHVPGMTGVPHCLEIFRGEVYCGGEFASSCGLPLSHVARLCRTGDCAGIGGRVVVGVDCRATSPGSAGRLIEVQPGDRYSITNRFGAYRHYTDPGFHTISLAPRRWWTQLCPTNPSEYRVNVQTRQDSFNGRNFGVEPVPGMHDLESSIGGGRAAIGRAVAYVIRLENVGTAPIEGTLRFRYDAMLDFDSASGQPRRIAPNELEWAVVPTVPSETRLVHVWLRVPISAHAGDEICAEAALDVQGDAYPNDNFAKLCSEILSSYDPNDITVHPTGSGEFGELTSADSVLTYTIRFQNTGTDTAYRVVLVNEMPGAIDLATFAPGPASHPYEISIISPRSLVWRFENVKLPDSASGRSASEGFVMYSVRLRKNLPPRTLIPNFAAIYFDFNSPVITNTVLSTTASSASVNEGRIASSPGLFHPNPTTGVLHLSAHADPVHDVAVYDLLGRRLRTFQGAMEPSAIVDLGDLPEGAYVVVAHARDGGVSTSLVVMR